MMKLTDKSILKTVFLAVFFLSGFSAMTGTAKTPTSTTPDFAYPARVETNAREKLESALKTNNPAEALRMLLNYTVASSLISHESATATLALMDSVNALLPEPFSGMGYLIKASFLSEIYQSDSYTFNHRVFNESMSDDNVMLWSRKDFSNSIDSLLSKSLAERESATALPLSRISELVTSNHSLETFTVYDFFVYKALELRDAIGSEQTIPFFKARQEGIDPLRLLQDLLTLHPEPDRARATAIIKISDLMPSGEKREFICRHIAEFGNSEFAVPLLVDYYNNYLVRNPKPDENLSPKVFTASELYQRALKLKASGTVKDKETVKQLNNLISSMAAPSATLLFPSTVCTNSDIQVIVNSENLKDFHVLLLKTGDREDNRYSKAELGKLKVTGTKKVSLNGNIPFASEDTLHFSISLPGRYTFAVSSSSRPEDIIGIQRYFYPTIIEVSDIDVINVNPTVFRNATDTTSPRENPAVFVIDAVNGAPIDGATVVFEDTSGRYDRKTNPKRETVTTSDEGRAVSPFENATAKATFNGNVAEGWLSRFQRFKVKGEQVRLFTDRAVYHPADTVKFLGIVYDIKNNGATLQNRSDITVKLRNANFEIIDSLKFETDASGRFSGVFPLPGEGLLGSWSIGNGNFFQSFEVAEYAAPTIMISLEKSKSTADEIEFKGMAATYSGMPLGSAEVDYAVNYQPLFTPYYRNANSESFHSSVRTNAEGEYSISLPLDNINPEEYNGIFIITATVKDNAGETATSPQVRFAVKDGFTIHPAIPDKLEVGNDSISVNVTVNDIMRLPVEKKVNYSVTDSAGNTVMAGDFISPLLETDFAGIPSGRYTFKFSLQEGGGEESQATTLIYRLSDKRPPVETCVWVPQTEIMTEEGIENIEIPFGCSYDGQHILCLISDSKGNSDYRWLVSDGLNFKVNIPAPAADERRFVTFIAFRNHNYESATVTLIPENQKKKLSLKTESFRNRIAPGEKESWKFFLEYDGTPKEGYAFAVLYDKALDAVAPLRWNTGLFIPSYPNLFNASGNSAYNSSDRFFGRSSTSPYFSEQQFGFQTYNYPLYMNGYRIYNLARSMDSKKMANLSAMKEEAVEDSAMEMATVTESVTETPMFAAGAMEEEGAATPAEDYQYRDIEHPVAFFAPMLTAGKDGTLTLEFTAPNFNTTWNLMIGAYDEQLQSARLELEAVASKPVMVKMLAPRFLRTGDKAAIAGRIYNNSQEINEIEGRFEIFNPITGEVLAKSSFGAFSLEPMGSQTVEISYQCPANLNAIGLRLFGSNDAHSDGEQTVIPVLPSSQPIVESIPFYLTPDEKGIEIALPAFDEGETVTFKYCDNPIWQAVTALPPIIEPANETLTSLLAAFYANCTGSGLMDRNPSVRKGLEMIIKGEAGDSAFVSNLNKDRALKTVTLNNTPWVNDARSENLRLSRLNSLLEKESTDTIIDGMWKRMLTYRNNDGGWSWCHGMKSSPWLTQTILVRLGLLKHNGYLPEQDKVRNTLYSGVRYTDDRIVKDYAEYKGDKKGFYSSLLNYLYMRSLYPELPMGKRLDKIKDEATAYFGNNWKQLSIENKAVSAIVLHRFGKGAKASEILSSLKQFASADKRKGVWFDNLERANGTAGALLTTAVVLSAFNEISPADEMIAGLRQWLLLQKLGQDWPQGYWSLDVIDALISCGKDWNQSSGRPFISIAGSPLADDEITALTGEVNVNIPVSGKKNRKIIIRRQSSSPAWGGIISQYIAPMESVTESGSEGLRVSKEILKISESPEGVEAVVSSELKTGDKVRVTLIVENDRTIDFVALTDERPACLKPTDQLSGYTVTDGIGCYKEEGLNSTNIFFGTLPRGRHIFSYECYVRMAGEYASGVATLQSLYSPALTAHSAGAILKVSGTDLED